MQPEWASLVAQRLKRLPAMRETQVQSLGQEDPLEKEMATHSSILAWRIPWTGEPARLQSTGLQRVGHDWATSLHSLVENDMEVSFMGICCVAQETQTGALNQPRGVRWGGRWEGAPEGRGRMCTYGWFMLRLDRKQQNSVKQLSFNKK